MNVKLHTHLKEKATQFLETVYRTHPEKLASRLITVYQEIDTTGTYIHTFEELSYGAKVAWRNSNRCIGRLFWDSLHVFDRRKISKAEEANRALKEHIHFATNNGKIRSAISIFPPKRPDGSLPLRIKNSKLIRYAGFKTGKQVLGDPLEIEFTKYCQSLGWKGEKGQFTLLPIVLQEEHQSPQLFEWNANDILEVTIDHPDLDWFKSLDLKWFALPVISDMILEIGGIEYPTAPFNGWYMLTEIGTRNFGDENRYNLLPVIAEKMGLNTRNNRSLWKDRALTELNQAVLYSFQKNKVALTDHHTAAKQFLKFAEREKEAGREVTGDWSWLVPPTAGSTSDVFHTEWNNVIKTPNYFYKEGKEEPKCPYHS